MIYSLSDNVDLLNLSKFTFPLFFTGFSPFFSFSSLIFFFSKLSSKSFSEPEVCFSTYEGFFTLLLCFLDLQSSSSLLELDFSFLRFTFEVVALFVTSLQILEQNCSNLLPFTLLKNLRQGGNLGNYIKENMCTHFFSSNPLNSAESSMPSS